MSVSVSVSVKTLMAAALAFGGAMAFQPEPASARSHHPVLARDGGLIRYYRPAGPRFARAPVVARNVAYRGAAYGPRHAWRGGYRNAYWGGSRYYGNPYRHYRRSSSGGAIAAGLIGGLALGTIASAAASPYYYPSYSYAPAYYPSAYYAPASYSPTYYAPAYYGATNTCFIERRRIVDPYGRVVVRRVQTCY